MTWVAVPNEDGTKSLVHSDLCDDYLAHHGIKGQKWGVRRFRNKAGTKKHKRASSKKSGKQRKANSKIAKRSKLHKDRGVRNWPLQQQLQDDLQRTQMQMIRDQMRQQQQLQDDLQRTQMQMMRDQMWQQQQLINNYNSTPMLF